MPRYAWANPTTGIREQDDSLRSAVTRIQGELKAAPDRFVDSVLLYDQKPCLLVSSNSDMRFTGPTIRARFVAWLKLRFMKAPEENTE